MDTTSDAAVRTSGRGILVGLVVGVPVSGVCLWLATRGLDPDRLWRTLRGADPGPLALAVLAMAAVYAAQSERWRILARGQADRPRRVFTALVIGAVAVNNLIPGRPGEALRAYWLSRSARIPFGRALGTVVVDRAADVLVLAGLLLFTVPFLGTPVWLSRLLLASVALCAIVLIALGAARFYAHHSVRGRSRAAAVVRSRSRIRHDISALVRGVAESVDRRRLLPAIGLSALAWLAFAAGAWAVGAALGIPLSPLEALFLTAVVNLGVAIPSSPGFVGTYHWLTVAALGLFAVGRSDAFALSVLLHAAWYVPTTLTGLALGARAGASWRPPARPEASPAGEHVA